MCHILDNGQCCVRPKFVYETAKFYDAAKRPTMYWLEAQYMPKIGWNALFNVRATYPRGNEFTLKASITLVW